VPMTSVLMIFETTHDYAVIVPLMISNLVSFFISARLQPTPIYEELAIQDGIHLPSEGTYWHSAQRQAAHVMRPATEVFPAPTTVSEALAKTQVSSLHAWPVTDDRGVLGVVSKTQLERAVANGEADKPLRLLVNSAEFPHVHADHPLYTVLERMGTTKLDLLPVVSRANIHHLLGVVMLPDVLNDFGVAQYDSPNHNP